MEDKEVQEINQKKLKEKGQKVFEQQQKQKMINYNPEQILFELLEFINQRGLELMNVTQQIKTAIINEKQSKLAQQNKPDKEKQ